MKTLNIKQVGRAKQAGFTIIELVVVILLLGILTATALPRFLDLSDEAHDAVVDATFGSMASAMALYRAGWFAQGQPGSTSAVTYGGVTTLFADTGTGYPAGDDNDNVIDDEDDCVDIFQNVLQTGGGNSVTAAAAANTTDPTAVGSGKAGDETPTTEFLAVYVDIGATTNDFCEYYYVGQFTAAGATVPYLRYSAFDGALIQPADVALIATD